MWLEALATRAARDEVANAYPFTLQSDGVFDTAPLWQAALRDFDSGVDPGAMSLRFHAGLVGAFAAPARALVLDDKAKAVALSGGCFQNALLLNLTVEALPDVSVLLHTQVPANDGGLALGQAAIAAAARLHDR